MAARARPPSITTPLPSPALGVRKGPAPLALAVYGSISVVTLGIALARSKSPIDTEAWLDLPDWSRPLVSTAAGIVLATLTIWSSRLLVARWSWAKQLHGDLRPVVRDASDGTLIVLGLASGLAEELFFRGLLAPLLGLIASSLIFGILHRVRGRAGWAWAAWATLMGLLFGALFLATGSLVGPIIAHILINALNLRYLRDTDIEPKKPRHLGGLLGQA